jgi:hypothetical protein
MNMSDKTTIHDLVAGIGFAFIGLFLLAFGIVLFLYAGAGVLFAVTAPPFYVYSAGMSLATGVSFTETFNVSYNVTMSFFAFGGMDIIMHMMPGTADLYDHIKNIGTNLGNNDAYFPYGTKPDLVLAVVNAVYYGLIALIVYRNIERITKTKAWILSRFDRGETPS